jgi:hypothetical protein
MNNVGGVTIPIYNYNFSLISPAFDFDLDFTFTFDLDFTFAFDSTSLPPSTSTLASSLMLPSCKKHPIDGGSANMINYTEITPGD